MSLATLLQAACIAAVILATAGIAGCAAQPQPQFVRADRIISLAPALTEDLFAIGAGSQVVGVSYGTDEPAAARKLPVVASATGVDRAGVMRLHPDVVVGIATESKVGHELDTTGISTVLYRDDTYDDIFFDLDGLGVLSGHRVRAQNLIARLQAQTRSIEARIPRRAKKPRVFVVLGVDPITTAGDGSFVARLIEIAGATNIAGDFQTARAPYSFAELGARQPDLVVAVAAKNLTRELNRAPWNTLRAVRAHHVFIARDFATLARPGPRYVQGLRWLVDRLALVAG